MATKIASDKIVQIAINGFGRIGRSVFRILDGRSDMQVVAINDMFTPEQLAYLLKYDTVMGTFEKDVSFDAKGVIVGGHHITIIKEKDPAKLPWKSLNVDVVVESTGRFTGRADLEKHLAAGSQRVLLTVPPKDDIDAMVVMGVNDDKLEAGHRMVSNASCTTNCLAPIAKVLDREFGIERGVMTTVHAYTNDQRLADWAHKDLRRSRAATENIIPTTTGAARAVGKVLPELKGKLDGIATRVPVSDGSVIDLAVQLKKSPNRDDINAAVKKWADGPMRGVLEFTTAPVVSSDILGNPHSSIFDSLSTHAAGDGYCRILSWYDNEWGYSNRCVDLIGKMAAFG